jgi:hypothetical protein
MKIKYINEEGNLLSYTTDYVPQIGETVIIGNTLYKVENKNVNIVSCSTEINVYVTE